MTAFFACHRRAPFLAHAESQAPPSPSLRGGCSEVFGDRSIAHGGGDGPLAGAGCMASTCVSETCFGEQGVGKTPRILVGSSKRSCGFFLLSRRYNPCASCIWSSDPVSRLRREISRVSELLRCACGGEKGSVCTPRGLGLR